MTEEEWRKILREGERANKKERTSKKVIERERKKERERVRETESERERERERKKKNMEVGREGLVDRDLRQLKMLLDARWTSSAPQFSSS